jgi:hypothetical protein
MDKTDRDRTSKSERYILDEFKGREEKKKERKKNG